MDRQLGSIAHEVHYPMCCKGVSWTAVFCGALVALGLGFLLNMFYLAIGLSVFSNNQGTSGSLVVGGLIALAIGTIVSLFVAGWVAGYIGRPYNHKRNLGVLHGFVAWCLALLFAVIFSVQIGHYVSAYSEFIAAATPESAFQGKAEEVREAVKEKVQTVKQMSPVSPQQTTAVELFVLFVMFAIGAVSASIGGHCGMLCKDDE